MAKSSPSIPKFLNVIESRKLNNHVYKNTGCFLFLTIPEEIILMQLSSNAGQDNYRYNVLNLYKMYNDYGHYFLWFCIQKSQIPDNSLFSEAEDLAMVSELCQSQERILKHYSFVSRTARHIVAHGIFQVPSLNYLDPKIIELQSIFSTILQDKDWPASDSDWKKIAQWITNEADILYDWLMKWGTLWGKSTANKKDLQQRFYYGRWEYSINKDSYQKQDKETYSYNYEFNGKKYPLYESGDKEMSSFAKVFSSQFVSDMKDYLSASVQGNVQSQYSEGNAYWKSDKPAVSWKILYKNINFAGIDYLRNEMMNQRITNACPDGLRLYLLGLTQKMTELPSIPTRPVRTTRRFSR